MLRFVARRSDHDVRRLAEVGYLIHRYHWGSQIAFTKFLECRSFSAVLAVPQAKVSSEHRCKKCLFLSLHTGTTIAGHITFLTGPGFQSHAPSQYLVPLV